MTAVEKVAAEVSRFEAILARRGQLWDDEAASLHAYRNAAKWLREDKDEAERVEIEALLAEEQEEIERQANDPNAKTRALFKNCKIKVPRKSSEK